MGYDLRGPNLGPMKLGGDPEQLLGHWAVSNKSLSGPLV